MKKYFVFAVQLLRSRFRLACLLFSSRANFYLESICRIWITVVGDVVGTGRRAVWSWGNIFPVNEMRRDVIWVGSLLPPDVTAQTGQIRLIDSRSSDRVVRHIHPPYHCASQYSFLQIF